jgi:L-alanine-DL-glutamate epimerase-like enolase superfamily enzyme
MRVDDGRPRSASSERPRSASSDQPEQLARLADEAEQQGFLTIVVPLSGRLGDDLATVRAIREAVGDRLELRLDGAERFDMEAARDFCAELEFERIGHLLDPLDTRQLHASAALGRQTSVPLAVARAITSPADALAGARCGAAALLVLELDRLGGLLPAHKATTIAEAAGVSVALSTGESVGITSAAMLQLAAARASLQCANECSLPQLADDILADPPELIDGMLTVPQAPGLGVQVDRGKLEQYQIG